MGVAHSLKRYEMKVKLLRVFVASPGDVHDERGIVREVIEDVNRTSGQEKWNVLSVTGWETDARPSFGADPQFLVNEQIADMSQYDLFVGILWSRFGTPTPRARSGTEEEFNRAVGEHRKHRRPEIMFYFRQSPTNLTTREQIAQKDKVLEFREKLQGGGLTWDYQDIEEFRRLFHKHLVMWLKEIRSETPGPPPEPRPRRSKAPKARQTGIVAPAPKVQRVSDSGGWESILDDKLLLNLDPQQVKQAETQRLAADGTVTARIPEVYHWLLAPTQKTPQSPVEWPAFRLPSGHDALAVRISKKLRNDESLITGYAGSSLKMELDRVPLCAMTVTSPSSSSPRTSLATSTSPGSRTPTSWSAPSATEPVC